MAEEIGKQNRQTPSDAEVEEANDNTQARRVDVDSKSDATMAPHPMPGAQSQDVTGDALRNDQRLENNSVEMSGTKTDRSHDDLGTAVDTPKAADTH